VTPASSVMQLITNGTALLADKNSSTADSL
jgi:hypothetical protein